MGEAQAGGFATPGPAYEVIEINKLKKRSESISFSKGKTARLDKVVRNESMDFYETNDAVKATQQRKAPSVGFSKEQKRSFAEMAARKKTKVPGVGAYKISEKAFKMLSPSPMARKR